MPKIKGKFAPLMADLANDERWLIQCTDDQKFLYQLILFTIYTTNGTAPDDPSYYKVRYNLARRKHSISTDLVQLKALFPKLVSTEKKLSLLNSVVYENRVDNNKPLEGEVDIEVDIDRKKNKTKTFNSHQEPLPSPTTEVGAKTKFGESGSVLLTEAEHSKLVSKFGVAGAEAKISKLEYYVLSRGKKYKSHYYTILSWEQNNKEKGGSFAVANQDRQDKRQFIDGLKLASGQG